MGREQADFIRLWAEYQATALRIYDEAAGSVNSPRAPPGSSLAPPPIILWSSHLTNPSIIENYLQKDRYTHITFKICNMKDKFKLIVILGILFKRGYQKMIHCRHNFWNEDTK